MSATVRDIHSAAAPVRTAAAPHADLTGLIWTLVRTDFKSRYHGTLSGFVWALLKPLTMFVVLTAVFSFVFTTTPAYKMNLLIGLFLWEFFAEGTKIGLIALHAKGFLLTKARFPSWVLVVASISNPLITIAVFAVAVVTFLTITAGAFPLSLIALFVVYIVAMGVIVIGVSLAGSVLFLRYRDLNQVWDVVIQAGFFYCPIIYPLGVIPERFHFYMYVWPPTAIIEFSRAVLIERQAPSLTGHLDLALVTVTVMGIGCWIYRRCATRVAEYV
jgi:lipopolysaccharide transport system permease protein